MSDQQNNQLETNCNIKYAIDAGMKLQAIANNSGILPTPTLILPEGVTAHTYEEMMPHPLHTRQHTSLKTATSFIDYVNYFKKNNTIITYSDELEAFKAFLDFHDQELPGWKNHTAIFKPKKTHEYLQWFNNDQKTMKQADFGLFIERNISDIIEPSGAEMLEIALTFQAKTNINFESSKRLDNGENQFTYTEEIKNSAGRSGQLKIPQEFSIGIVIYEGLLPYQIKAKLRYRINDGALVMWYELIRPHKVIEANLEDLKAQILDGTKDIKFFNATA